MYPKKRDLVRQYIYVNYLPNWVSFFGEEELIKTRKYFATNSYSATKWLFIFDEKCSLATTEREKQIKRHESYFSRKLGTRIRLG